MRKENLGKNLSQTKSSVRLNVESDKNELYEELYKIALKNMDKVLASKTKYFLITKNPLDMKTILVDYGFKPSDIDRVIIGPCNDRLQACRRELMPFSEC